MTRLKQAWLALCGKLEPEVREVEKVVEREVVVLGTPEPVTVFFVSVKTGRKVWRATSSATCSAMHQVDEYAPQYFATCEQAHATHPNSAVENRHLWRIGNRYFDDLKVTEVKLQPKPKIAKGKRK